MLQEIEIEIEIEIGGSHHTLLVASRWNHPSSLVGVRHHGPWPGIGDLEKWRIEELDN